jgi:hypothetical protein
MGFAVPYLVNLLCRTNLFVYGLWSNMCMEQLQTLPARPCLFKTISFANVGVSAILVFAQGFR